MRLRRNKAKYKRKNGLKIFGVQSSLVGILLFALFLWYSPESPFATEIDVGLEIETHVSANDLYQFGAATIGETIFAQRHLLAENCDGEEDAAHGDEVLMPDDIFTQKQRLQGGAVILHLLCMVYIFIGIAEVCGSYFEPSLENISTYLGLSKDVAGATFMAAGSSAPEFFTSMVGTFIAKSDVGVGTIVGSAVFNILIIIGVCCIAATGVRVEWYSVTRDVLFYCCSIIMLVIVILDRYVTVWESLAVFMLYLVYIFAMKNNTRLENYFNTEAAKVRVPSLWQEKVAKFCDSDIFNAVMYFVIAVNIVIIFIDMSDGKGKQEQITKVWQALNTAFSVSFILELVVKHYAYGFYGYWRNVVNAFDGALVFLIILEWTLASNALVGSLRGLRLFKIMRALRALRIVRLYRALHKDYADAQTQTSFEEIMFSAAIDRLKIMDDGEIVAQEDDRLLGGPDENGAVGLNAVEMDDLKSEDPNANVLIAGNADGAEVIDGGDKDDLLKPTTEGDDDDDDDEVPDLPWELGGSAKEKVWALFTFPLNMGMFLTIPHADREWKCLGEYTAKKKIIIASCQFVMSVVWIAMYTFVMVWMSTIVGDTFQIPPPIMGLTILAAGTSLPDTMASVNQAKKGEGSAAVANAVGSNVFDICIALGFPWLLLSLITSKPAQINSESLTLLVFTLFLTVILLVLSLSFFKWKLTKRLGYVLFIAYAVFIAESLLLEYTTIFDSGGAVSECP